ncbi:hypothetical protein P9112_004752 [Eukaryota sp. TZLM1-RC]
MKHQRDPSLLTPYLTIEEATLVCLELVAYISFLIIFTLAFKAQRSPMAGYYLTDSIKQRLEGLSDVTLPREILPFLSSTMAQNIFAPPSNRSSSEHIFSSYNTLIGTIRIVSKRVRLDSCSAPSLFTKLDCFDDLNEYNEETSHYGPSKQFKWYHPEKISDHQFKGHLTRYSGGGYVVEFPKNQMAVLNLFNYLLINDFIDLQTRVIFFDFSLYNPAVNTFAVVRLAFEIPSTGQVISSSTIRTVKLFNTLCSNDVHRSFLELCVVFAELVYFCVSIVRCSQVGFKAYFSVWYHILDLVIHLMFVGVIYHRIVSIGLLRNVNSLKHLDLMTFEKVSSVLDYELNLIALLSCCLFFKLFKFFRISHKLSQLIHVISAALVDIAWFSVAFFVIMLGFACWANLTFGSHLLDFKTIQHSMMTLFRMILTDFDYYSLYHVNSVIGPLFLICFMFFAFFVLINMFIAIITDSFTLIREAEEAYADCPLVSTIHSTTRKWFRRLCRLVGLSPPTGTETSPINQRFIINNEVSTSEVNDGHSVHCPSCKKSLKMKIMSQ